MLEPANRADSVFHLLEAVVRCGGREWKARAEVELVGAVDPMCAPLGERGRPARLRLAHRRSALVDGGLAAEVMLAELGETHGYHRARQHGRAERPKIVERLAQHGAVVDAGRKHDLGVELDAVLRKLTELRDDLWRGWIAEQIAAYDGIGCVDRNVEWRQPVLDDPLDVVRLEIGQGREVAVAERQPVIIIADVQHVPKTGRQPVHEAEVAAVGAAADPGGLDGDAHRLIERPLDLELDLLAIGLAHVEDELFFSGEELPVEKVLQLPAIHGEELGAGCQAQLRSDRLRLDGDDLDHRGGNLAPCPAKSKSPNYFHQRASSRVSAAASARSRGSRYLHPAGATTLSGRRRNDDGYTDPRSG